MFDFISVGDTMQDIFLEMSPENAHLHRFRHESQEICFTYADKIPVLAKHDTIGGNSANAAIGFARLGHRTAIYTHVGGDDQGVRIQKEFIKNKVADDYIVVDADKESNFNTVINLEAERTILLYHVHRTYRFPKLEPASWLYLSSMGEGFADIFPAVLEYIKEYNIKLCYQPGTFQLQYGASASKAILAHTDLFCVNKEEAELFVGLKPTNNFREHLDGLLEMGIKRALVTDGPKGAYVSDGKEYKYIGIIKEAPRIEATGAGDSFSSCFTAALAAGNSLSEALRWGQAQASSVIQKIGPQAGLLHRNELEEILQHYSHLQAVDITAHGQPVHPADV